MLKLVVTTFTAIALIAVAFTTLREVNAELPMQGATLEVRVVAMPHEDGSVEFGIEHDGQRVLPQGRFLSVALAEARIGTWLSSAPVEIVGPSQLPAVLGGGNEYRASDDLWESPGFGRSIETVREYAKPYGDGRIEFALGHYGQLMQPRARFLTPRLKQERVGQWLRSTPVEVVAQVTTAEVLRLVSTDIYDRLNQKELPVDVARACVLETVTEPVAEVYRALRADASWSFGALERAMNNIGSPFIKHVSDYNENWDTIATLHATASTWTGFAYSGVPADRYRFHIRVLRHVDAPPPDQWLAVDFACGETDDSSQNVTPVDGEGGDLEGS